MLLFDDIRCPVSGRLVCGAGRAGIEPAGDVVIDLILQVAHLYNSLRKPFGDIRQLTVGAAFVGKQPFQQILLVFFRGVSALLQQIGRAHVGHLPIGQGAAGHAKGKLLLRGLFQRLHQFGAQHHGIHTVRCADDVGVHGKVQPVGIVACIHKIHRPDNVAGLHGIVLLQCLHTGGKGVVCTVGVKLHDAVDDAEFLHRRVVLDPALLQIVGVARCRQILRNGGGIRFHDAPALLVLILGSIPPPHELVVPLGGIHRVLVADGTDAGIQVGGIGGLAQVEQVAPIFDVLGGLPLGFHSLVAVVQHVQAGGGIKAAVKIPAKHLEHQLV